MSDGPSASELGIVIDNTQPQDEILTPTDQWISSPQNIADFSDDEDRTLDILAARAVRGRWYNVKPQPYFDSFKRDHLFVEESQEKPDLSMITTASTSDLSRLLESAAYHISTPRLVPHVEAIIERFAQELTTHQGWHNVSSELERDLSQIAHHTINIFNRIALDTQEPIDSEVIEKLFNYFRSNNADISFEAASMVGSLIDFDSRSDTDKSQHIAQRTVEEVVNKILSPNADQDLNIAWLLTNQLSAERPLLADQILVECVRKAASEQQLARIATHIMDAMGVQKAESVLKTISAQEPLVAEKFTQLTNLFTRDRGSERVVDIGELYDNKFDIGAHHPDKERDAYEAALLRKHLEGKGRVLDIAAGTGRTKEMLEEQGFKVIAFDYSRGNVARMKEADPKGAVFVGDWYNLPFASGSIEAADCMGRSFAHVENNVNGDRFFKSVNRILPVNGILIMDIPDNSKGHFDTSLQHYDSVLRSQGITIHNHSEIVDSPNGRDIMRRYVPSLGQLAALAKANGFVTEVVGRQDYVFNKQENTNFYLKLTKKSTPLPSDQTLHLRDLVETGEAWLGEDDQDIRDLIRIQSPPEEEAA